MRSTIYKEYTNYALVFILIALSGFPFFYMDPLFRPLLLVSCVFAVFVFFKRGHKWGTFIWKYLLVFFLIVLGQFFVFSYFPLITIFGYLLRIILAFCIIKITGKTFVDYYTKILYFFCVVSFFFYFPTILFPDFEHFIVSNITPLFDLPQDPNNMYSITPNVIIFNFNSELNNPSSTLIRNSGPFWEPGAFAGFTIIALIFNIIKTHRLFNRVNLVFIIAILSTLSTAGYIALSLLVFFYLLQNAKPVFKYLFIPIVIGVSFYAFYNLEFLNAKIDKNVQSIGVSNTSNRFVSAITDIEDVSEYWLFGRGFNVKTRYDTRDIIFEETHRNNGITGLLVNIGIIGIILYFFMMLKSFKQFCEVNKFTPYFAYSSMIVILTIGFAEGYFTKVLFIVLTMLFLVFNEKVAGTRNSKYE